MGANHGKSAFSLELISLFYLALESAGKIASANPSEVNKPASPERASDEGKRLSDTTSAPLDQNAGSSAEVYDSAWSNEPPFWLCKKTFVEILETATPCISVDKRPKSQLVWRSRICGIS